MGFHSNCNAGQIQPLFPPDTHSVPHCGLTTGVSPHMNILFNLNDLSDLWGWWGSKFPQVTQLVDGTSGAQAAWSRALFSEELGKTHQQSNVSLSSTRWRALAWPGRCSSFLKQDLKVPFTAIPCSLQSENPWAPDSKWGQLRRWEEQGLPFLFSSARKRPPLILTVLIAIHTVCTG